MLSSCTFHDFSLYNRKVGDILHESHDGDFSELHFIQCFVLYCILLYYSLLIFVTSRISRRGNRIGLVCALVCVCMCVCVKVTESIHNGKRTLGRRNFTTQVAGGASTLRHFHLTITFVSAFVFHSKITVSSELLEMLLVTWWERGLRNE